MVIVWFFYTLFFTALFLLFQRMPAAQESSLALWALYAALPCITLARKIYLASRPYRPAVAAASLLARIMGAALLLAPVFSVRRSMAAQLALPAALKNLGVVCLLLMALFYFYTMLEAKIHRLAGPQPHPKAKEAGAAAAAAANPKPVEKPFGAIAVKPAALNADELRFYWQLQRSVSGCGLFALSKVAFNALFAGDFEAAGNADFALIDAASGRLVLLLELQPPHAPQGASSLTELAQRVHTPLLRFKAGAQISWPKLQALMAQRYPRCAFHYQQKIEPV